MTARESSRGGARSSSPGPRRSARPRGRPSSGSPTVPLHADDAEPRVGRAERLADDRLDRLVGAVGDVEAVELDVLGRLDLVGRSDRVVVARAVERAVSDSRRVEGEVEVLLEDRLDLALVVGEGELAAVEVAAGGAGVHLRRPADDAVVQVAVVDRVAVGLIEVRRALRLVREDGAVAVGAGHGREDRRVRRRVVGRVATPGSAAAGRRCGS